MAFGSLDNLRDMAAQERIGLEFISQQRGDGRFLATACRTVALDALTDCRAFWFDPFRETEVGKGVLVGTIEPRLRRECRDLRQRGIKLLVRATENTSATGCK